ncbi:MAG: DUF983 domain-containing protein [Sphingobacteriia bacterium]|nr:DUF983 domain-containing protein [Sphingobacteriia bacterium]
MSKPTPIPSVFTAMVKCHCPKCRNGKMFSYSPYNLSQFGNMNSHCTHCGFKFEIEPGFYWGSMYISYALSVGVSVIVSILLWQFAGNPSIWTYGGIIGLLISGGSPLMFRYSRVLMLYLFGSVDFDPKLYSH